MQSFDFDFDNLPTSGKLENEPWADSYWQSNKGGISYRWLSTSPQIFNYQSPTLSAAQTMSADEILALSPAEKYDIYVGNYSYPTVKREFRRTSVDNESWEGICHGWAPVSLLFQEPNPVTLVGANNVKVTFGSSDIKALLSYFQGEIASPSGQSLGSRCNADLSKTPEAARSPECRDTNAGAFHVIISNMIGLRRKGFIADVTRDLEVWNQPVFEFRSAVKSTRYGASPGAAPGTTQEVTLSTRMYYGQEASASYKPRLVNGTNSTSWKEYEYRLELNRDGRIIGGEWITQQRPDFLWTQEAPVFEGYYGRILEIYNASVQG
jgi:hypothetical protein